MQKYIFFFIFSVVLIVAANGVTNVHARESLGLQISPAKTELNLKPGSTEKIQITVKNISTGPKTIVVSFDDFTPEPTGQPKILFDGQKNEAHGLNGYVTGAPSFSIPAGNLYEYTATVTVPADAEGKTRFGVIRFAEKGASADLSGSVASLLLFNVGAPKNYQADLSNLKITDSSVLIPEAADATFEVALNNSGKYMFEPDVTVDIVSQDNQVLTTLKPTSTGRVLPGSTRTFTFEWEGSLQADTSYNAVPRATLPGGKTIKSSAEPVELYAKPVVATVTPVEEPKEQESGLSPLLIAGLAGLLLLLFAGVLLFMKKRRKSVTADNGLNTTPPPPVAQAIPPSTTVDQNTDDTNR